ncbi:MAG: hypothetical protein PHI18_07820 [bacterium]|nr:hypothetical protein [bacterium]
MSSFSGPVPAGEEGVPQELLTVRTLLQGLPRLCCPASFEYEFQRRLRGIAGGGRTHRKARNWVLGWTGAGLGFAAALAVAVFVFRVGIGSSPTPGMIAGDASKATETPVMSSPNSSPIEVPPAGSEAVPQQLASEETPVAGHASRDSQAVISPTPLPKDLYHMVGGNE